MQVHLIFGGPGTGKTERLANIYKESVGTYGDGRVRFVSFTRSQVKRDRKKVAKSMGSKLAAKGFSTIHSAGLKSYGNINAKIIDRFELHNMSNFLGVNMESVLKGIDYMKNIKSDNYAVGANKAGMTSKLFAKCAYFYEQLKELKCREGRTIDFSDMLQHAIRINYTVDCDVAIIDEAQDLSALQWQMVYTLFKNVKHLYVAGDPNQAIYAFNGGLPNYMNEMRYDTIEYLEQSYRCCSAVMSVADMVARKMKKPVRTPKSNGDEQGFAVFYPKKDLSVFKDTIIRTVKSGKKVLVLACTYDQLCKVETAMFFPDGVKTNRPIKYAFISGRQKKIKKVNSNLVFSTVHQAKGMESDYVFFNISSGRSVNSYLEYKDIFKDFDEFYKVLYTGITRAKKGIVFFEMTQWRTDEVHATEGLRYANIGKPYYQKYLEWGNEKPKVKKKPSRPNNRH